MNPSHYTEVAIGSLNDDNNALLLATSRMCKDALWLKEHVSVGDDGEWDYKLNKALNAHDEDIKQIAELEIGTGKQNTYQGKVTIDALLRAFSDFHSMISSTYPLGEEEAEFVVAYEFLESRIEFRKKIFLTNISEVPRKKRKKTEKKTNWEMWGVIVAVIGIFITIIFSSI